MTLAASVAAQTHTPAYEVRYAGSRIPNVLSIEREVSFDQQSQTCTITVGAFFPFMPDSISLVQVYEGHDDQTVIAFTGYVDDVKKGCYPATWQIVCRDVLKKAQDIWLDDVGVTYNSTQAETAVADLLGRAGLSVTAATSSFTIADIQPAAFKLVSLMDAVNQIAALIGWRCWAGPDGTVYFQPSKPKPATTAAWSYTRGVDILDYQYDFTDRNTRNRVVTVGYGSIRAAVNSSSPYVPSGYYRTAILSSELIDTQGMADTFAAWMLTDLNVATESLDTFKVVGNPLIGVGNTIHVTDVSRGLNANFFVFSVRSRLDGETGEYTQEMTIVRQQGTTSVNYEPGTPADGPVPTPDTSPSDIPPDDPTTLTPGKGNLLYVSTLKGLAKCTGAFGTDGTDGDPVWTAINSGLSGDALKIRWFNLDAFSREGDHFTAGWAMTDDGLYRVTGLPDSPVWTQQLTVAAAAALIGKTEGQTRLVPHFAPSVRASGVVVTLAGYLDHTFMGQDNWYWYVLWSLDSGATWQTDLTKYLVSFGNGQTELKITPSFHTDNLYYVSGDVRGNHITPPDPNPAVFSVRITLSGATLSALVLDTSFTTSYTQYTRMYMPFCDNSGNVYGDDQRAYTFNTEYGSGTNALRRFTSYGSPLWSNGYTPPSYTDIGSTGMGGAGGGTPTPLWFFTNMWDEDYGVAVDVNNIWLTADGCGTWTRLQSPAVGARTFSPTYQFMVPADPNVVFFTGSGNAGVALPCFTPDGGTTFVDISEYGEAGALDTVLGLTAGDMAYSTCFVDYYRV